MSREIVLREGNRLLAYGKRKNFLLEKQMLLLQKFWELYNCQLRKNPNRTMNELAPDLLKKIIVTFATDGIVSVVPQICHTISSFR
jgi:hypothetical protein